MFVHVSSVCNSWHHAVIYITHLRMLVISMYRDIKQTNKTNKTKLNQQKNRTSSDYYGSVFATSKYDFVFFCSTLLYFNMSAYLVSNYRHLSISAAKFATSATVFCHDFRTQITYKCVIGELPVKFTRNWQPSFWPTTNIQLIMGPIDNHSTLI